MLILGCSTNCTSDCSECRSVQQVQQQRQSSDAFSTVVSTWLQTLIPTVPPIRYLHSWYATSAKLSGVAVIGGLLKTKSRVGGAESGAVAAYLMIPAHSTNVRSLADTGKSCCARSHLANISQLHLMQTLFHLAKLRYRHVHIATYRTAPT